MHEALRPAAAETMTTGSTELIRILRRRMRGLIVTITLTLLGTALVLSMIAPRYNATAVMRVDTADIGMPDSIAASTAPPSIRDIEMRQAHQIDTQIQLLQSRAVARQVVRDLALTGDPEFNPALPIPSTGLLRWFSDTFFPARPPAKLIVTPQMSEKVTDRLLSALKVAQDSTSNYINVTVSSTSPEKAARIANKVATTYMDTQIRERRASQIRDAEALRRRAGELRQQLVSTELKIANYRRAHGIDAEVGGAGDAAQVSRAGSELAASKAAVSEAAARVASGDATVSPLLTELKAREGVLTAQIAQLRTSYGGGHPDVRKAEAELAQVRQTISEEGERVQRQLRAEVNAQAARRTTLAGDVAGLRAQSLDRGVTGVPLADYGRDVTALQSVYVSILSRLKQTLSDVVKADAALASPALRPTQASFPRSMPIMGAASAAALIFGFLYVIVAEATDNHVRTAGQVYELSRLATFGMIPALNRRDDLPAHLMVTDRPYATFAEAARSVERKLARTLPRESGNVVVVTSPLPGDGKTTVAVAIAAAATATGRSAIVVELDLRRPDLSTLAQPGSESRDLLDYLQGEASLEDIIQQNAALPALKFIHARRSAADPQALLASRKVADMLATLRRTFDYVIVNTPPILAAGDARLAGQLADAVLLVLPWEHTTPDLVRSTLEQFDGDITGVVFNRVSYIRHARLALGDGLQYYQRVRGYYRDPHDQRRRPRLPIFDRAA